MSIHRTIADIHFEQLASSLRYYPINPVLLDLSYDLKASSDIDLTPRGSISAEHSTISQTPMDLDPMFTMPPQMHLCSELWQSPTTVLQYSHDHPCSHFGQMKTLHQSVCNTIAGLPVYVKDYCKSCTTCSAPNLCATNLRTSQATSIPKALEFHLHGFIEKLPHLRYTRFYHC